MAEFTVDRHVFVCLYMYVCIGMQQWPWSLAATHMYCLENRGEQ